MASSKPQIEQIDPNKKGKNLKSSTNDAKVSKPLLWTLLVLILLVLVGGGVYYWKSQQAKKKYNDLTAQISTQKSQNEDLQKQNDDLQSQINTLKSSTTTEDEASITTRVKYVYTQWLANIGNDMTNLINNLRDQHYITSSLATSLKAAHSYDPVTCSQNPADNYIYDSPSILTTIAANMTVTGNYPSSKIAIKEALIKSGGLWQINTITCPNQ